MIPHPPAETGVGRVARHAGRPECQGTTPEALRPLPVNSPRHVLWALLVVGWLALIVFFIVGPYVLH